MEAILFLVLVGVIMFVAFGYMTISYEVERRTESRGALEAEVKVERLNNGEICCAA